jgi:Zn-dependent oligopeptidase
VWLLQGSALGELQRYAQVIVCCDRAIQLKSDLLENWVVRGVVLAKLQQHEETLVVLRPRNPNKELLKI